MRDAITDIHEDFDELRFLIDGYKHTLLTAKKRVHSLSDHPSAAFLLQQSDTLLQKLTDLDKQINEWDAKAVTSTRANIDKIIDAKRNLFIELRSSIPLIASLSIATEWQSPSYAHSLHSEAGGQTGQIIANINDYKRDQHLNEATYQQQFLRAYVDGLKVPSGAYLTSSGMAALTTIITFLILQQKIRGPVMIGQSMYFENIEILESFFREKHVVKVDEMDTPAILRRFADTQPDLLVFDSLCNSPSVAVPDIPTILKYVSRHAKKETFFVIDNSTLSIALQPLRFLRIPTMVKLIVFESLNKYHQFGLDRVTAGIVWYRGFGLEKLYYARDHAGTNIPDHSVYALPPPNRKYLKKRLDRLNRNANYLADSLANFISKHKVKKIDAIIYPGLKSHPSFQWSKDYAFQGCYFVISFRKPYQNVREYQRFVKKVLKNARDNHVSINGGTSFGFNTTRVYLTARNTDYGMPFIRVSVGTETLGELEKIQYVFQQTLQSF